MASVISEIVPLSSKDCFYIVERHKTMFTYPLHQHREFELNFIENAKGVRRIVGDSVEEVTGDYDLVLIGGENLEHTWEQGTCNSPDIREITVQFSPDLFAGDFLKRNQFASIYSMLEKAKYGISFPLEAIMKVYRWLDVLASNPDSFEQFVNFLEILNGISQFEGKVLASSSFAHAQKTEEGRRINLVKEYINTHYSEDLKLETLADIAGMSSTSFSRFFKAATAKTLSSFIIDVRLGYAARLLVDSQKNISEICYSCGFNNLSNFNRIFLSKRGMTPRDFRKMYVKTKILV